MNTIIDQIRSEVERRIKSWQTRGEHSPEGQWKDTCVSRVTELTDLLSFLSTIQEKSEKPINPVCEGLEEEILRYRKHNSLYNHSEKGIADYISNVASHFAQWQKEKDDIKATRIARKAIDAYKAEMMKDSIVISNDAFQDACMRNYNEGQIVGAKKAREQMTKEAVEGEVENTFGYKTIRPDLKQLDTILESLSEGDKVRIVIVKEK